MAQVLNDFLIWFAWFSAASSLYLLLGYTVARRFRRRQAQTQNKQPHSPRPTQSHHT